MHNLVPFVQFKKREKNPYRSVNFSKVAGFIANRVTHQKLVKEDYTKMKIQSYIRHEVWRLQFEIGWLDHVNVTRKGSKYVKEFSEE